VHFLIGNCCNSKIRSRPNSWQYKYNWIYSVVLPFSNQLCFDLITQRSSRRKALVLCFTWVYFEGEDTKGKEAQIVCKSRFIRFTTNTFNAYLGIDCATEYLSSGKMHREESKGNCNYLPEFSSTH